MKQPFERAFKTTIALEGGYKNTPEKETKYGLSKGDYPEEDIKNLTRERAKEIYFTNYWKRMNCHKLDGFGSVAIELFYTGVNAGVDKGVKLFQEALNLTNRNEPDYINIPVDGKVGSQTIAALKAIQNLDIFFETINLLQTEFYIQLMRGNEVNEKYIGWFNKVHLMTPIEKCSNLP
ncbi:MAG: glycosyl hydrolase 108 family protein [Bacteroidota bacterium]